MSDIVVLNEEIQERLRFILDNFVIDENQFKAYGYHVPPPPVDTTTPIVTVEVPIDASQGTATSQPIETPVTPPSVVPEAPPIQVNPPPPVQNDLLHRFLMWLDKILHFKLF